MLREPSRALKLEFLRMDEQGSWSAMDVADRIYDCLRSYRNDRCAIFIDPNSVQDLLRESGLQADFLDPEENMHWTGLQRQLRPKQKLRRIFVGDYDEWFLWLMKWQRFNAFHVLVLVAPIRRMGDDDRRGYFDGLLTRLLNKPSVHRVIVVEEDRFQPAVRKWMGADSGDIPELMGKFGREQFVDALSSLLYGTRLSKRDFYLAAANTLFSKLNPDWAADFQYIKLRPALVERKHGKFYSAGYYGKEKVESLETPAARESIEDPEQPLPPLFKHTKRRGPSELDQSYLEELTRILLDSQGWFTVAGLYEYVYTKSQNTIQTSSSLPKIFNEHYDDEAPSYSHVFLPSRPLLRRIAERLEEEGKLQKATWVREIGRPTTVYHLPGQLPFDAKNRCGQCAFYVLLRRQCRIWWLLDRSYGSRHDRWARDGAHPLSGFEIHRMRNSWRIGPHSSACSKFVDKKKDYTRLALPALCDMCRERLPEAQPKWSMVVCATCRTRYFRFRQSKVKVLTSYEHEFKRRYHELAGVDPASDIKRLIEDRQGSAGSVVEQAIFDERPPRGRRRPRLRPQDGDALPRRQDAREGREALRLQEAERRVAPARGQHDNRPRRRGERGAEGRSRERRDDREVNLEVAGSQQPRGASAKEVRHSPRRGEGGQRAPTVPAQDGPRHGPELDARHGARRLPRSHVGGRCADFHQEAEGVRAAPRARASCQVLGLRGPGHEGVLELLLPGAQRHIPEVRPAQEGALRAGVRHEPRGTGKRLHCRGRGDKLPPPEEAVQGQSDKRPAWLGPQSGRRVSPQEEVEPGGPWVDSRPHRPLQVRGQREAARGRLGRQRELEGLLQRDRQARGAVLLPEARSSRGSASHRGGRGHHAHVL